MSATRASKDIEIGQALWAAADALRGSMDASEYKNVVLGLIFLKYLSDRAEVAETGYLLSRNLVCSIKLTLLKKVRHTTILS